MGANTRILEEAFAMTLLADIWQVKKPRIPPLLASLAHQFANSSPVPRDLAQRWRVPSSGDAIAQLEHPSHAAVPEAPNNPLNPSDRKNSSTLSNSSIVSVP